MIYFQGTSTGDETSVHIVGSFYSIQVGNYLIIDIIFTYLNI